MYTGYVCKGTSPDDPVRLTTLLHARTAIYFTNTLLCCHRFVAFSCIGVRTQSLLRVYLHERWRHTLQIISPSHIHQSCGAWTTANMSLQSRKYQRRFTTSDLPHCRTWTKGPSLLTRTFAPDSATSSFPNI